MERHALQDLLLESRGRYHCLTKAILEVTHEVVAGRHGRRVTKAQRKRLASLHGLLLAHAEASAGIQALLSRYLAESEMETVARMALASDIDAVREKAA